MNPAIPVNSVRRNVRSMVCALIKLAALLVISASAHGQAILHVDDDASPGGDGSTWPTAFDSLQAGLDAAAVIATTEPVELRVAQGRYVPTKRTDEADPRSATFQLLNNVSLLGGFAGVGAANPDLRDLDVFETILTGDISGDDGPDFANYGENTYHVTTGSGTDASAVMDGVTIAGGSTSVSNRGLDLLGGGMLNVEGSPTIRNCWFRANRGSYGGAMYNRNSHPLIQRCRFTGNGANTPAPNVHVGQGGSIRNQLGSKPLIEDCEFFENTAVNGAGVACTADAEAHVHRSVFIQNSAEASAAMIADSGLFHVVEDCVFEGNITTIGAGAATLVVSEHGRVARCEFRNNRTIMAVGALSLGGDYQSTSTFTVVDCKFAGNTAETYIGALSCAGFLAATVVNCEFIRNGANQSGGVFVSPSSSAQITNCSFIGQVGGAITVQTMGMAEVVNCVIANSTPSSITWLDSTDPPLHLDVQSSCIQGGWSGLGSNNIDLDPMFIQPGCGNLRLAHGSPCIDTGDNSAVPPDVTTDLDGQPRILNGIVDMGAYEGGHDMLPPTACESDLDAGEFVRLIPSGGPFNPQVNAAVNVTNITETNDAWATVEQTESHIHPGAAGFRDLAEILTMQTSLVNGEMFVRVMIPFDADDIGILNPLEVDVTYFDASANRWRLAAEANTVNSPKHEGPVGDRIVVEGVAGPYGFTAQVGDYGVFWNAGKQRGFAWANVDHATDFGAGTLLSSCQADCAEPSGVVGPTDVIAVLSAWGSVIPGEPGDVNADNMVNIDDLLFVVNSWGPCS